jgi:alkanesulfonate monooxygenase SsuD/methylene tetrahydromethanopterin reductase-like flavin-dependent oxidoreductase (luciferase family)
MEDLRQPTATAFALRDPFPWDELSSTVRLGEGLGYRALFLPEITGRDALAAITGLAGETATLLMGPGVLPLPSRDPQLLAMASATAQERSRGRLVLGLGTGPARMGSLAELRAVVVALREALRSGTSALGGRHLTLSLVPDTPPPVWIAALGPRAVRLAGEVADGVLLNWCTPQRVARAVDEVAEGAARVGRDPREVTIAVYIRACLADDAAAALGALRAQAGEYACFPSYARQFARMGLGDDADRAAAAVDVGRPQDVSEHLVREVSLLGEPSLARGRLEGYRRAGAHLPVVYPVSVGGDRSSVLQTLERLAPRA